jgi:hypothetical protein
MTLFVCDSSCLHPYECDGVDKCIHCRDEKTAEHDPDECWLCHWDDGEWQTKRQTDEMAP